MRCCVGGLAEPAPCEQALALAAGRYRCEYIAVGMGVLGNGRVASACHSNLPRSAPPFCTSEGGWGTTEGSGPFAQCGHRPATDRPAPCAGVAWVVVIDAQTCSQPLWKALITTSKGHALASFLRVP